MNHLKMGIVGLGNMGSAHANCLLSGEISGMQLCAVCDILPERVEKFTQPHPALKGYTDYRKMIAEGGIDGILIAVPHPFHADMAITALENGLHVLTEKPVDVTVSKAEKLNRVAKESGKVFGIMFNQRTNPLFAKAREIVQSGELGELKRTVWLITNWYRTQAYYDSGDWRATWKGEGGGVLLNQAPHNLDLWQWICGMPKSVTGFCDIAKYHRIEVEDDATLFTRYENGATGLFVTSTGEYPGTNRLEISGTKGKIVLENGLLKYWKLQTEESVVRKESRENFPNIPTEYTEIEQTEPESAHRGILQNFADAVTKGTPLLAPGSDGILELTLSNAAYLSAFQKGKEIRLPFPPEEFDRLLESLQQNSKHFQTGNQSNQNNSYQTRWQVNW